MILVESAFHFSLLFEHDLFRPAFGRRSIERNDKPVPGLRAGGKPVATFRDHALARQNCSGLTCWTFGIWRTLVSTSAGTVPSISTSAMALPPSDSRPRWKVAILIPASARSVAKRPTKPGLS